MAAKVNLVVGQSGRDNSASLLARYQEVAGAEFGAACWVAPTERACDDVLEVIARKAGVILAPRVVTFPELAAELCGPNTTHHVIPVPHQRMILTHLLKEMRKKSALPLLGPSIEFPGFVDAVFDFISEIKGLGVSAAAFEQFTQQLNQAHGIRAKDREIALIIARFEELFAKHGYVDREAQYSLALDRLQSSSRKQIARALFFDGFVAFTPPQMKLLHALAAYADELWISLPYDEAYTERVELYAAAAATLAELQRQFASSQKMTSRDETSRPTGLAWLTTHLFREAAEPGDDVTGLHLIEAPGIVGEARMVARSIKTMIAEGVSTANILISSRDLSVNGDLLVEVFAEYGIPLDIESAAPLAGRPVVAALLAAASLDVHDWLFAETTALLRSTLFRPDWPDAITDELVVTDTEVLLRLLGETRHRQHYLSAVERLAMAPEVPFQDEEESGSLLRRRHELAKRCLPFVQKFFVAWDDAPKKATFTDHAAWLQQFAETLGFTRDNTDKSAFDRLWHELERWSVRERQLAGDDQPLSRAEFLARLAEISAAISVVNEQSRPGCVRAVPAELAPALRYQHLFLLGLGEGSFPRLGEHGPLYDSAERNGFRAVGLDLRGTEGRLAEEMLLFHRLLSGATKSITLCYPAIDEKGQSLLAGTFLQNVKSCFAEGIVPVARRQMLVEGIDSQPPLSRAEFRVRWAGERSTARTGHAEPATSPVEEHLLAAEELVRDRFRTDTFGRHDGIMTASVARDVIAGEFGPKARFSATALEDYVTCPFRFFMHQVLQLDPLDDPIEEVAAHRRGVAIHRALSSLHRKAKSHTDNIGDRLIGELQAAIADESKHASSPATNKLWELECDRLRRMARRYSEQWSEFLGWWSDLGIAPAPSHLETQFSAKGSMSITVGSDVIQLAGRIDRIDTAQLQDGTLGFWVFDYKTGSRPMSSNDAATLVKLQLGIYSLAAETLLGGDKATRPLGLAYWSVAGGGVQSVPTRTKKTAWHDAPERWQEMKSRLLPWLAEIVKRIRAGEFPLRPRHDKKSCEHCSFGRACRINQSRHVEKSWDLPLPVMGGEP